MFSACHTHSSTQPHTQTHKISLHVRVERGSQPRPTTPIHWKHAPQAHRTPEEPTAQHRDGRIRLRRNAYPRHLRKHRPARRCNHRLQPRAKLPQRQPRLDEHYRRRAHAVLLLRTLRCLHQWLRLDPAHLRALQHHRALLPLPLPLRQHLRGHRGALPHPPVSLPRLTRSHLLPAGHPRRLPYRQALDPPRPLPRPHSRLGRRTRRHRAGLALIPLPLGRHTRPHLHLPDARRALRIHLHRLLVPRRLPPHARTAQRRVRRTRPPPRIRAGTGTPPRRAGRTHTHRPRNARYCGALALQHYFPGGWGTLRRRERPHRTRPAGRATGSGSAERTGYCRADPRAHRRHGTRLPHPDAFPTRATAHRRGNHLRTRARPQRCTRTRGAEPPRRATRHLHRNHRHHGAHPAAGCRAGGVPHRAGGAHQRTQALPRRGNHRHHSLG